MKWGMSGVVVGAVALAVAACGGGAERGAKEPPSSKGGDGMLLKVRIAAERIDLPNGLVVALRPEPADVGVRVQVRYHAGSKDDPAGRAGLAHLVEHLMFQGSRNAPNDYQTYIDRMGAVANASTTRDQTDYYEDVPAAELPRALWLEADRMAYPLDRVDEASFARERDVVENEWREHYADLPYGNVEAIARAAVFDPSHPYSRSTIGDGKQLDAATLEDAKAFARSHYGPNDATLVLCGNFDPKTARELVTKYFATIPPVARPPSRSFPAPRMSASKTIEVVADVDAPMVAYAWAGPPTHTGGIEALQLGLSEVGGSLDYRAVIEKKNAVDVSWRIDHGHLGSLAMITMRLQKGASASSAAGDLDEYLTKGARIGRPTRWARFADERTRLMVGEIASLEDPAGRTRRILHDLEYHDGADATQSDLRRFQAIEIEDLGVTIEQYLEGAPHAKIVVRPEKGAPRAGKVASR